MEIKTETPGSISYGTRLAPCAKLLGGRSPFFGAEHSEHFTEHTELAEEVISVCSVKRSAPSVSIKQAKNYTSDTEKP